MSKNRYVNTKFWVDNYIISLKMNEKLLFVYCLTNTFSNILGIYEISLRQIHFDTKIGMPKIKEILKKFETDGKIRYEDGWLGIKNFTKHQLNNPKVNIGIVTLLKKVPDNLIQWANIDYDRLHIDYDSLSHLNLNTNININFNYKLGKFEGITPKYLKELEETYPGANVSHEIDKMTNWLIDNPKKKRQGKRSFISNWLKKANENVKELESEGLRRLKQGDYSGR